MSIRAVVHCTTVVRYQPIDLLQRNNANSHVNKIMLGIPARPLGYIGRVDSIRGHGTNSNPGEEQQSKMSPMVTLAKVKAGEENNCRPLRQAVRSWYQLSCSIG